jgi:succinate dehydrogenase / fumarate reductase cytochrome b subunit
MTDAHSWKSRLTSTVMMELAAALSGLVMVLFIAGHLGGNLLLFLGPDAFNAYAARLQALGPLLFLVRFVMLSALLAHVTMTVWLKLLGMGAARPGRYAVTARRAQRGLGTRTMIYTGLLILCFIALHVYDFTFADKTGARSMVGGQSLGLYGVVFNGFADPVHAVLYMLAMWAVGLHFSHLLASLWVTLGVLADRATPGADFTARVLGALVALGFTSIPLYVLLKAHLLS